MPQEARRAKTVLPDQTLTTVHCAHVSEPLVLKASTQMGDGVKRSNNGEQVRECCRKIDDTKKKERGPTEARHISWERACVIKEIRDALWHPRADALLSSFPIPEDRFPPVPLSLPPRKAPASEQPGWPVHGQYRRWQRTRENISISGRPRACSVRVRVPPVCFGPHGARLIFIGPARLSRCPRGSLSNSSARPSLHRQD